MIFTTAQWPVPAVFVGYRLVDSGHYYQGTALARAALMKGLSSHIQNCRYIQAKPIPLAFPNRKNHDKTKLLALLQNCNRKPMPCKWLSCQETFISEKIIPS